jgi:hypothetical protein
MVTAKHIVEGVYRAGGTLYARVNGRGPIELAAWAEAESELLRRERAGEKTDIGRIFEELRTSPPESVLALSKMIAQREPSIVQGAQFEDLGGVDNWIFHEDPNVDMAVLDWRPSATVDVIPFALSRSSDSRAHCARGHRPR